MGHRRKPGASEVSLAAHQHLLLGREPRDWGDGLGLRTAAKPESKAGHQMAPTHSATQGLLLPVSASCGHWPLATTITTCSIQA